MQSTTMAFWNLDFYVIFQEPLYLAIKKCDKILPIEIQNERIKNIGFADDTTAFTKNENSFIKYKSCLADLCNIINSENYSDVCIVESTLVSL